MSVTQFMTKIGRGARANLFEIKVADGPEAMKFFCNAIQVPGRSISNNSIKILNFTIPLAGETTFPEITMNVLNDQGYTTRSYIESWMNDIRAINETKGLNNLSYLKQIDISLKDELDITYRTYEVKGCFPIDLGPIDLNWTNSDTIQEYSVTFAYSYFLNSTNELGALGGIGSAISKQVSNITNIFK